MRKYKPTIWLSVGLVSLTLAIALSAYILGLMPDGHQAELESRAKVAESLAVQLAGAANRNDNTTLEETLNSVVTRNDDVYSSAFRRADGSIVLSAGDHEKFWKKLEGGKSTPTHVSVPLFGEGGLQGTIELSFGPATAGKRIFGVPITLIMFLGFLMSFGFIGYFLMLRQTLNELDPGRVIPERVQRSFDTLNEGVIILDEKERILLVNKAFSKLYDDGNELKIGTKINTLPWRMVDGRAQAGGYPWHTAIREKRETREGFLSLRTPKGDIHNFAVNATTISDEKDKTIGAIVTLTDLTGQKRDKDELEEVAKKLELIEEQAEHQGNELIYLTGHDSLTNCLNRRAFIQRLEKDLEASTNDSGLMSVLFIDLDQFKPFNEIHGAATGDRTLSGVAEGIKLSIGSAGYVGRYAGDQFCIALPGTDATKAGKISETIRVMISDDTKNLLPRRANITVSIGITHGAGDGFAAQTLINHAEQAADFAKSSGRNKSVHWSQNIDALNQDQLSKATPSDQVGGTSPDKEPQDGKSVVRTDMDSTSNLNEVDVFMSNANRVLKIAETNGKQSAFLQVSINSWDYLTEALDEISTIALIRAIKRRTSSVLRERDQIAFIAASGDLVISVSEVESRKDAGWIANEILQKLKKPFKVVGREIFVATDAGVALFPQDGGTSEILVRNAGSAMRRAREESMLEGYKFYAPGMVKSSLDRLEIESGIREALQRDEFELHFQPIVDLQTGALSAAECLLRCNNMKLRSVGMDIVIDVAEKSSLIGEIDMWVLSTGLRQMQKWCDSGLILPKISINISATQFTNIEFMDKVFNKIKSVRFSPSRVQIEVTETAKMADVETAAPQLKRLQQLGAVIALDDFGTGQASLTYLQRLHPDVIKIDRSFVTGVHANHANATMVSAMTVMAHCLGLKVVVEGVEEEEECRFLRDTKCDEMQGYIISKPMAANVMSEWMALFAREKGTTSFKSDPIATQTNSEADPVEERAA